MIKYITNEFGDKLCTNSNNQLHCLEGPAIIWSWGTKEWLVEGKLHRIDGPAVENINGDKNWFIHGKEFTEAEYPQAVLMYKCKMVLES